MSEARDLINAHLYPVLATFAVIYGAIQIAPIAQDARYRIQCIEKTGADWSAISYCTDEVADR